MRKNKLLLLWSSVGVLALLVYAAVEENFLKSWRRIQASARTDAGPVDVRLRQVVVPPLKVTDRCVTCHLGMAPGEQGVHGPRVVAAHPPVVHDPAEFGCTPCHGGQGRATEQHAAHGNVEFWPQPMIPLKDAYAGCGTCHTHVRVPSAGQLARGRDLIERLDCLACHRIDRRGGTLRPGGMGPHAEREEYGMEGPDLSRVGLKGFDPDWYDKHLDQHRRAKAGPWKESFGEIRAADRATIEPYLASRVGTPRLVAAKAAFHSLGCRGCHKINGVGGDDGPDLSRSGEKDPGQLNFSHVPAPHTVVNWHAAHLRDPAKIVPGSKMPKFDLDDEQIDLLTLYIMSLRRSEFPEAYWPKDRIRAVRFGEREFSTDGETLYGTFCAACHGLRGEGRRFPGTAPFPSVANPDFLAVASDEFLTDTIFNGRIGRRMPAWGGSEGGLKREEIQAIIGYLRRTGDVTKAEPDQHDRRRWVEADPQKGRPLFVSLCAGCHGERGEGKQAPQLANRNLLAAASDTYLAQTIARGRRGTDMLGFSQPSPVHPALAPAEIEALVAYIRSLQEPSQ